MSAIITSPLLKTYTLEEFRQLPEPPGGEKLELIGGVLYMTPPPGGPHNETVANLIREFALYLAPRGYPGRIYVPRAPIWTAPATYLEPDLMYLSAERLESASLDHFTSADLVVEVISPGSAVYDRNTKAETYQALGVVELWLIDPYARCMDSINWSGEEIRRHFEASDTLRSELFPGFHPSLSDLLPLE